MKHFLFAFFTLLLFPGLALAEKVALVIGNSDYRSVARLDNPENDSREVSRALTRQGFDVIAANDLTRVQMRDTLRAFRERADRADVALVYYAGHGIEIGGRNYLVPIDARLEDERDADLEMVDLELVLAQISGAGALKMVVLDACRNNPFLVKMKRSVAGRAASSGLGRIEFAEADTLIAYAAAAGEITPDGIAGTNSPFSHAFVAALEGPPADVRQLLGRVRDKMRESVPGAAPFVYTSLGGGEFVINPNSATSPVAPVLAEPKTSSISADFVRIDSSGSFEDWDEFLIRHGDEADNPLYAFALQRREALRPKAPAAPVQMASLGIDEEQRTLQIVEPEPEMPEGEATRYLQELLKDAGCYSGEVDGILGRGSRAALDRFSKASGVRIAANATAGGAPLREAIATIEDNPEAECTVTARAPAPKRTAPRPQPAAAVPVPVPAPAPQAEPDEAAPLVQIAVPGLTVTVPQIVPNLGNRDKPSRKERREQKAAARDSNVRELSKPAIGYTEPRRNRLTPSKPSDCIGGRKKLFICD